MTAFKAARFLVLLSVLCPLVASADEEIKGRRITMNFAEGQEPTYKPGSLNFQTNAYRNEPVVFRTVWRFDAEPTAAPVRINAGPFVFVWVNGQCVGEYPKARSPVETDLAGHLRAGDNVVAISVDKAGFALAGYAEVGGKRVDLATSPENWRIWKFAPLTILEKEKFMTAARLDGVRSAPTKEGAEPGVTCTPADGERIVAAELKRRLTKLLDDVEYESELLAERGIAVTGDRAVLWGGVDAVRPEVIAAAAKVHNQCRQGRTMLANVRGDDARSRQALALARKAIEGWAAVLDACDGIIVEGNRLKYAHLAGAVLAKGPFVKSGRLPSAIIADLERDDGKAALEKLSTLAKTLESVEKLIEASLGAPVNELDSAIANKAGWIDDPTLVDSRPAAWGVRFNPTEVSWFMDLNGKWRFKMDPNNTGLKETVHEFAYNIANQWPEITVPGTWEKQGDEFQKNNPNAPGDTPYPGVNERTDGPYNGYAWYRKKILVPEEWSGYDLELYIGAIDDWDWAYWNGEEIGHTGAKTKNWWRVPRTYKIPKDKVRFGGYNVIAIRIYDCGAGGGIIADGVQLRCNALKASFENRPKTARKRTRTFSGPMSPAAILTVGEKQLEMFGWDFRGSAGPDGVLLNLKGKSRYVSFLKLPKGKLVTVYDRAKDGPFGKNWLLLWNKPGRPDGDLPIQLVLTAQPESISVQCEQTGTSKVVVDFGAEGVQVLALRPIRADSKAAGPKDAAVAQTCEFWSKAALAYPMHYAELAKLAGGRKDLLEVADVYEYRVFKDAWGTEPLQIAPLPPLACYGLSVEARDLKTSAKPMDLSLGDYGRFHAFVGTNVCRYTVPVDTLPRMGGFTSYCFSGADVGAPGNIKEIEAMTVTGCNTYRPQSNNGGEPILKLTRWTNEAGLNMCYNIDGGFGARPEAITHWVTIGKQVKDLPMWAITYDLINEPANMPPDVYNPQIKKMVAALRQVDANHMVYVETPHSFASIDQFVNLAPVDDPAVVYTFHDYDYRLKPRWPTMTMDIRNLEHQWLPAYKFALKYDAPTAISEYGGFEQTPYDTWTNASALVLLSDFFKVFDQFGMHHQYYSNRGVARVRPDGSIRLSLVHEGYRRLFAGDTFYRFRENWQETIKKGD